MKKILIADDDRAMLTLLSFNFRQNDFEVTTAENGQKAYDKARKAPFDLILLDMMMPELSGLEVVEKLRRENIFTPILILTARDDDELRLKSLMSGSDKYLDKTTPIKEIIVHSEALIRRAQAYGIQPVKSDEAPAKENLKFDKIEINFSKKTVRFNGRDLTLTKREFEILEFLVDSKGEPVSREALLKHFWGIDNPPETRTIDVLVSKLRKKLDNQYIKTKRGFGYYFEEA